MQAALGPQRAGEHPLEDRFAAIGKIPLLTRLREIARETRILGEHAVEAEARLAKVPLEPPGGAHETAASSADHKILRDRAAAAERALEETRAELRTRRAAERRLEALVWALEAETESLTYRLSARSESRLALEGQVEGVEDGGLVGWAWYPLRMDRAAVVEVFVDGVFAAAALATEPRSENALLGKRGGRCGFAIPLEKLPLGGVGREVRVRAVGSAATLPGCPLRLRQDGTVETGSLDRSGAMPESDVPNGAGASSTMALDQAPARRHFRVAAANSV
jgi:hypothetical protein